MINQRHRAVIWALVALVCIWAAALTAYMLARNAKVTPDKVRAYTTAVDFAHLTGAAREAAWRRLAAMLNALTLEERQALRMDHTAYRWFAEMTEEEKGEFLEATMPTGFKQMIDAFQQLPEDKRKQTVDQAMRRLHQDQERIAAGGQPNLDGNTNDVALNEELRQKVTTIGLKSFYSESSAQTKAELAPLLEEMQRTMQSGRLLRGGPRP